MEEEMSAIMYEPMQLLQEQSANLNSKGEVAMQNCFLRAGGNPDRFATCVQDYTEKITKTMEPLQFKMMFLAKTAENCLKRGTNKNQCKAEVNDIAKLIVEKLRTDISKL